MFFWVLILLVINGIVTFAYTAMNTPEPDKAWAMYATTFLYIVGLTQFGIVFSAIMRIAKSNWAKYFNRLGEVLTLSFIPVAVVMLVILIIGGTDHLFYWAPGAEAHGAAGGAGGAGGAHNGHMSPWLNEKFFVWRYIVTWALFYITSYIYFKGCRAEEKAEAEGPAVGPGAEALTSRLNILAGFVMFSFVWANTNLAWDYGMMIIRHWESTIIPGYYWVGNIFAGSAFIYIISFYFIKRKPAEPMDRWHLDAMGKLLMGFTLLWVYLFWSQHIVFWYGDLPARTAPHVKKMVGPFQPVFMVMILALFIVPFLALLFRRIKLCAATLYVVALIICIGVWVNRYMMVIPVFSDGTESVFFSWTGISLTAGGISSIFLSVIFFRKLFPKVPITTYVPKSGGHH